MASGCCAPIIPNIPNLSAIPQPIMLSGKYACIGCFVEQEIPVVVGVTPLWVRSHLSSFVWHIAQ